MRDVELDKALAAIAQGQSPEQVLRQLAHGLTNKFLHVPTTRLKKAGEQGDSDYIRWAHDFFDLPVSGDNSLVRNHANTGVKKRDEP
jgi:glutamyl-tRNA reductase